MKSTLHMIDHAASLAGIRPSTLRLYIRLGLISPVWGTNRDVDPYIHCNRERKCMLFTEEDINKIKAVKESRRFNVVLAKEKYWEKRRDNVF